MHSLSLILTLVLSNTVTHGVTAAPAAPATDSTVDLGYATYKSTVDHSTGTTPFLGIRYAAAPTGNNRWRAPQPPPTISGVQMATLEPNQCYQADYGVGAGSANPTPKLKRDGIVKRDQSSSEDCLFLSVHVPGQVSPSAKLPVVVWIHGGGYVAGQDSTYDGGLLVKNAKNKIISVVIQYRLGVFGFLSSADIKKDGALNAGLLDQEFALKWVQTYISKFGGDPSKVTLWGQSAGAGAILDHIVAHGGATNPPLFRGAITSSVYLPPQYNFDAAIPKNIYSQVVSQTKCSSASNPLSCLRSADASILEAANVAINAAAFHSTNAFVPVIDGSYITQPVVKSLAQRKVNGQALLSIRNTNEGLIFIDQATTLTVPQYIANLFPTLDAATIQTVVKAYKGLGSDFDTLSAILGESTFTCPSFRARAAFSKTWKGHFAISPASHLQDLLYYFPGPAPPFLPPAFKNDQFLASFPMMFFNFIVNLDPNSQIDGSGLLPSWPSSSSAASASSGGMEMVFNKTQDNQPDVRLVGVDAGLISRCSMWESIATLTAQ